MRRTVKYMISQLSRLGFVFGVILPAISWGQASPQAEALFRDGRPLMKAGNLAEAYAAFESSGRAEHNVAAVLSLADVAGRTTSTRQCGVTAR